MLMQRHYARHNNYSWLVGSEVSIQKKTFYMMFTFTYSVTIGLLHRPVYALLATAIIDKSSAAAEMGDRATAK